MELYRTIVPSALRLSWRQRQLWWFALAMLWVGTVGEVELIWRSVDFGDPGLLLTLARGVRQTGLLTARGLAQALVTVRADPLAAAKLLLVLGVLTAVVGALTWLAMVAQGALVTGVAYAAADRPVSFRRSWGIGQRKFWPVLTLNAAARLLTMLVFSSLWWLRHLPPLLFVLLFVLGGLAVLGVLVGLKFAVAAVVLEDVPVRAAAARARVLWQQRWVDHVTLAGVLSLVTATAVIALLVAVLLALMPLLLITGIARLLDFTAGVRFYFSLSWLGVAGLAALAAVAVTTGHWAAWTMAFVRAAASPQRN